MTMRIGIPLPLPGHTLRSSIELAARQEDEGLTDLWTSEVDAYDAFTPLAAAAVGTRSVRLGTAVVPAYTRPPALLAMTAATLAELSDGRFCLGIGSSTPVMVGGWMGLDAALPLTRVRETAEAVRIILAGGKAEVQGTTLEVHGFRFGRPATRVPIMVGALGPRMIRLAGEIADGVILSFTATDALSTVLEGFRAGAASAGREPGEVVLERLVHVGPGSGSDLREEARAWVAAYGIVPVYNRSFARQGYEEEAAALRAAWEARSRGAARRAVSDVLLDALCVFGDRDHVLERLAAIHGAGVTTILLSPVASAGDPSAARDTAAGLRGLLRDLAR
jgi:probable F420-dependent oxidoreductase